MDLILKNQINPLSQQETDNISNKSNNLNEENQNNSFFLHQISWDCFVEKTNLQNTKPYKLKKKTQSLLQINVCPDQKLKSESFVRINRDEIIKELNKTKKTNFKKIVNKKIAKDTHFDNLKTCSQISISFDNKKEKGNDTLSKDIKKMNLMKSSLNSGSERNNFENLKNILTKIFNNQFIDFEMIEFLKIPERIILKAILERKYHSEISLNNDVSFLVEVINNMINSDSLKRPEENYKFIFKRCLKYMKNQMKEFSKKKLKKKDFEKAFYEYYFMDIAKKEGIPLEHFFHPKNSQALKCLPYVTPKTINSYYINNISKSKEFMTQFFDYLDNKLIREYEKMIEIKISSLTYRWNDDFEKSNNKSGVIQEICDYIKKNNKCKLPWNIKEIKEAIKIVKNLLS